VLQCGGEDRGAALRIARHRRQCRRPEWHRALRFAAP
jgi:hypothetical protein